MDFQVIFSNILINRSTSNIVRAAEKVISMSGKSEPKEARKSMKPKRGSGPSPRVVACKDERAEGRSFVTVMKKLGISLFALSHKFASLAQFIVDTISEMLIKGEIQSHETAAMIYRTNAQSRYLEEACVQKNLPYVIRGGGASFYKRAEVKDCLCFLRWLHNGNDEGSMIRAMKTPSRGIGDAAMKEFREYYEEVDNYHREHFPEKKRLSSLDVLISMTDGKSNSPYILEEGAPEASVFISKRALNRFSPFSTKMRVIRDNAHTLTVDQLLFYIIEELELVSHFDTISKSKSEFEERRENVQELRQAAKRYVGYGPALKTQDVNSADEFASETALGNFLDDVALVADITEGGDKSSENRFVVNLMTIHGSKGMEFDAVFVVGNEEGTLPSNLALQEGEGSVALEEEKRLCYVAMTRAKTRLLMTWRKEVTNFSNWSDDGPRTSKKDRSRFLDALVSKKSPKSNSGQQGGTGSRIPDPDSLLRKRQSVGSQQKVSRSTRTIRQPPVSQSFSSRSYLSQARGESDSKRKPPGATTRRADATRRPVVKTARPSRPYLSQTRTSESTQPRKRVVSGVRPSSSIESSMDQPRKWKEAGPRKAVARSVTPERRRPISTNSVPQKKDSFNGNTTGARVSTARPKPENDKTRAQMDSTWFFPVGSAVVHEKLGKGKVLVPPKTATGIELPVLVEFSDGTQKQFCAKGSDLVPDLGL
jgi:hypothetical protein